MHTDKIENLAHGTYKVGKYFAALFVRRRAIGILPMSEYLLVVGSAPCLRLKDTKTSWPHYGCVAIAVNAVVRICRNLHDLQVQKK